MKASELKTHLIRQRKYVTTDDFRKQVEAWRNIGWEKAKVKAVSGGDRLALDQMQNVQTFDITVRYNSDILESDRWWDPVKDRHYNIDAIDDVDDLHVWLKMRCVLSDQ